MQPLPPFNPDAVCPKCHHDIIVTRWKQTKPGSFHPRTEWLSRCCSRCQFIWDEACIEPKENPA